MRTGFFEKTENRILLLIAFLSFLLFYPSFFNFFTHDDFFHLKIANAGSSSEFLQFFNLKQGPEGWGLYRPLATQVFYLLSWKVFNHNPLGMHIVLFVFFLAVCYLVYKIAFVLSESRKTALTSAFIYTLSASHFGQLYFLATQEIFLAFFFLLGVLSFIFYIENGRRLHFYLTLGAFILALFSKETAVVFPGVLVLLYAYSKRQKKKTVLLKKLLFLLLPFAVLLAFYFYFRIFLLRFYIRGIVYLGFFTQSFQYFNVVRVVVF
jgi:protein O-mannosyl-transferase